MVRGGHCVTEIAANLYKAKFHIPNDETHFNFHKFAVISMIVQSFLTNPTIGTLVNYCPQSLGGLSIFWS